MDRKKIIIIIALGILIFGTMALAMRTKNKSTNQQQPEKLTEEQKEFADEFSKAMQDAKNETKK
jgi:flagellar basal body-associated protein FliL